MRYVSYIMEGGFILAFFAVFATGVTLLMIPIIKRAWGVKTDNGTIVRFTIIILFGLLLAQYVGIALWYGPISSVVDEADPWVSFMTFKPLLWSTIFEGHSKMYVEPIGKFFTSGQIANLYYGLAHILSLAGLGIASFLLYLKNKEKRQLILMIATTIFILQTTLIGITML